MEGQGFYSYDQYNEHWNYAYGNLFIFGALISAQQGTTQWNGCSISESMFFLEIELYLLCIKVKEHFISPRYLS